MKPKYTHKENAHVICMLIMLLRQVPQDPPASPTAPQANVFIQILQLIAVKLFCTHWLVIE